MDAGDHLPAHVLANPASPAARWFQVWDIDGEAGTALVCTAPVPKTARPALRVVQGGKVDKAKAS